MARDGYAKALPIFPEKLPEAIAATVSPNGKFVGALNVPSPFPRSTINWLLAGSATATSKVPFCRNESATRDTGVVSAPVLVVLAVGNVPDPSLLFRSTVTLEEVALDPVVTISLL